MDPPQTGKEECKELCTLKHLIISNLFESNYIVTLELRAFNVCAVPLDCGNTIVYLDKIHWIVFIMLRITSEHKIKMSKFFGKSSELPGIPKISLDW